MKIQKDENAEKEAEQFAKQIVNRYGISSYDLFSRTVGNARLECFTTRGAKCAEMIEDALKIYNIFGLEGRIFNKALISLNKEHIKTDSHNEDKEIQQNIKMKLTDELHNQFLSDDNDHALADAMLNATWKMVKKNLDKSAFVSVQKDQREWASSKRDEGAASYAASLPPSQAYTKVMQERIAELATLVAREPRLGDYEAEHQMFNIYKDKGEYQIDGSASSPEGNTCMFDGKLTKDNGWYKVHEDGLPPYYVLFTDKGAFIQYNGSGSEHGCGVNVGFNGEYKFVK